MTEREGRQAVTRVAATWIGTPFVWEQCIKGVAVDCGRFLAAVFNEAGVKNIDIPGLRKISPRSPQWFLHRSDESFLNVIRLFAEEYELQPGQAPQSGDITVAEFGRDWGHSAIVLQWPRVIAAANEHVVTEWQDINRSPQYGSRKRKYFNPWGVNV